MSLPRATKDSTTRIQKIFNLSLPVVLPQKTAGSTPAARTESPLHSNEEEKDFEGGLLSSPESAVYRNHEEALLKATITTAEALSFLRLNLLELKSQLGIKEMKELTGWSRSCFDGYCTAVAKIFRKKVNELDKVVNSLAFQVFEQGLREFIPNSLEAGANELVISLNFNKARVEILIQDNGNGFKPEKLAKLNEVIRNNKNGNNFIASSVASDKNKAAGDAGGIGKGVSSVIDTIIRNGGEIELGLNEKAKRENIKVHGASIKLVSRPEIAKEINIKESLTATTSYKPLY